MALADGIDSSSNKTVTAMAAKWVVLLQGAITRYPAKSTAHDEGYAEQPCIPPGRL